MGRHRVATDGHSMEARGGLHFLMGGEARDSEKSCNLGSQYARFEARQEHLHRVRDH